ncbi:MAG: 4Fe-4S binding protein [Bacteroidales bacterium]
MGIGLLKKARIVVSLLFFVLITFLFIDFGNTFSSDFIKGILYFQFIPSILKFIQVSAIVFSGFVVVLVLTILFGRVYCSFLCPVGTLQDIFIVVAKNLKKKTIQISSLKIAGDTDYLRGLFYSWFLEMFFC